MPVQHGTEDALDIVKPREDARRRSKKNSIVINNISKDSLNFYDERAI